MAPETKKQKTGEKVTALKMTTTDCKPSALLDPQACGGPGGNPLALLPALTVSGSIFPFLQINDKWHLSHTSREMLRMVKASREQEGTTTCILREARLPTTIMYRTFSGVDFRVVQSQAFRFLLRNSSGETANVIFLLENDVWGEHRNWSGCRRSLETFPSPTRVTVQFHGSCEGLNPTTGLFRCGGNGVGHLEYARSFPFHHQRESLLYTYVCAQRVAAFPDHLEYPSAEYVMRLFATFANFPADFDWSKDYSDRNTEVELIYRKARNDSEWRQHLVRVVVAGEMKLDEVYKEGY